MRYVSVTGAGAADVIAVAKAQVDASSDVGIWAVMHGIDALHVTGRDYTVILNRGITRITSNGYEWKKIR